MPLPGRVGPAAADRSGEDGRASRTESVCSSVVWGGRRTRPPRASPRVIRAPGDQLRDCGAGRPPAVRGSPRSEGRSLLRPAGAVRAKRRQSPGSRTAASTPRVSAANRRRPWRPNGPRLALRRGRRASSVLRSRNGTQPTHAEAACSPGFRPADPQPTSCLSPGLPRSGEGAAAPRYQRTAGVRIRGAGQRRGAAPGCATVPSPTAARPPSPPTLISTSVTSGAPYPSSSSSLGNSGPAGATRAAGWSPQSPATTQSPGTRGGRPS